MNTSTSSQSEADDRGDDLSFPVLPSPNRGKSDGLNKDRKSTFVPDDTRQQVSPTETSLNNKMLGDYELIKILGEGGMGVVYLGKHVALGRYAAIKVLRHGSIASPELKYRFESEAILAAKLHHAHIVQVFELGQTSDGLFIAFEYVDGKTLADLIGGQPQPSQLVAESIKTLAEALAHAHQQGVIHRDLKPANILIDQSQILKITDFGLARTLEDSTGPTRTGEIVGTPAYMSPEQASGATKLIGPGTDIYALGTIMYEMLTGTAPFRGTDVMLVILTVIYQEPPAPRQLDRSIPRDLEKICLKCLEKKPSKRYLSAGELAADLERYLSGQPIVARPVSSVEKLWKLANRNRLASSFIVVVLLGMLTFLGYSIWKNNQLEYLLARSDNNFRDALLAVQRRIDTAGQPADQVLEEELQFLSSIRQRSDSQISTRYEGAIAASLSGLILKKLGRHEESLKTLSEAETILKKLTHDDADWNNWYRSELSGVLVTRSQTLQEMGRYPESEQAGQQALEVLSKLMAEEPDNPDYLQEQGAIWHNLGLLARMQGNTEESITRYQQAIVFKKKLLEGDARNIKYHADLVVSLSNLASVLIGQKKLDDAAKFLEEARELIGKLPEYIHQSGSQRLVFANVDLNLGLVRRNQFRAKEALELIGQGTGKLQQLCKDYPEMYDWNKTCADAEVELGQTLLLSDELPMNLQEPLKNNAKKVLSEAISNFESAINRYEKLAKEFPDNPMYQKSADQLKPGLVELRSFLTK